MIDLCVWFTYDLLMIYLCFFIIYFTYNPWSTYIAVYYQLIMIHSSPSTFNLDIDNLTENLSTLNTNISDNYVQ